MVLSERKVIVNTLKRMLAPERRELLKRLRESVGFTQRDMADALGEDIARLRKLEQEGSPKFWVVYGYMMVVEEAKGVSVARDVVKQMCD